MGKTGFLNFVVFFILAFASVIAQDSVNAKRIMLDNPETLFDFWVGSWEATWDEGEGKMGKGINEIVKILDEKVIQENFRVTAGKNIGFKGISISVYQPSIGNWKQAWADNQGGYFDFISEIDGNKRMFKTSPIHTKGKTITSRMVFMDIKTDSFTWVWESSIDGEATWKPNWRIEYVRI